MDADPPGMPGDRDPPSTARTGARLTAAVLAWQLAMVAAVTLAPFRFALPDRFAIMLSGTTFDVGANILLFVPFGFLHRLTRPAGSDRRAAATLALGLLCSALIETAQLFESMRFTSPLDVLANGAGAWLGALACDEVRRRIRPGAGFVGRLSLEIPLMGLAWLLVPLLWLGSVAAEGEAVRAALLALPGLAGGTLLAGVHRHGLGRPGSASPAGVAIAATTGMGLGVFPLLATQPQAALALVALVGGYTRVLAGRAPAPEPDRRFEQRTLRSTLPFLATHLFALAWLRSPHEPGAIQTLALLRMLEPIAAFTVLGYVLAEWRGRLEEGARVVALHVTARALPVAALAMGARHLPERPVVAMTLVALNTAVALYGALLYRLQRAHIRALLAEGIVMGRGRSRSRPPTDPAEGRATAAGWKLVSSDVHPPR